MNKLTVFLLIVVGINGQSFAQKQTYDITSYLVPSGWTQEVNADGVRLYHLDKNTGVYEFALLFPSIASTASPQSNFSDAWQQLVKRVVTNIGEPIMLLPTADNGWDIISGQSDFTDGTNKGTVRLLTATGYSKTTSIVLMTNSNSGKDPFLDLLKTIELKGALPSSTKQASSATTSKVATSSVSSTSATNKDIHYEVWECQANNVSTLKLELKTVVLSPDKKCIYQMPERGLHGITPENSNESGSWGNVSDKGDRLVLENTRYGNMDLYKISSTAMSRYPNSKSVIYKRCKSVDGLRFEGAYSAELSYYNGKTDIISRQIDPAKRPILFFKKDGTYVNEGIEFSNLTYGDPFAIGKGTYEIVNYSLLLHTESGKTLQLAFTPILDGGTEVNDGFIINHNLFYRLGKQFQPQR